MCRSIPIIVFVIEQNQYKKRKIKNNLTRSQFEQYSWKWIGMESMVFFAVVIENGNLITFHVIQFFHFSFPSFCQIFSRYLLSFLVACYCGFYMKSPICIEIPNDSQEYIKLFGKQFLCGLCEVRTHTVKDHRKMSEIELRRPKIRSLKYIFSILVFHFRKLKIKIQAPFKLKMITLFTCLNGFSLGVSINLHIENMLYTTWWRQQQYNKTH